ncbi:MAG TPA: hypothetical protein VHB99_19925 [Pirellulales bacterium]|nr:hypothetical protein [Pirellulales bacterium]
MSVATDQPSTRQGSRASAAEARSTKPGDAPLPRAKGGLRSLSVAPLKAIWRLLKPLRQPFMSRVDQHIATVLRADLNVLSDQLNKFAVQTAQAQQQSLIAMRETNIFIEGLVREIAQLQEQVQSLSQNCTPLAAWADGDGGRQATTSPSRFEPYEIGS